MRRSQCIQPAFRFIASLLSGLCFLIFSSSALAQSQWPYDPGPLYPFGAPNPNQSDPEARIFDRLIGEHECIQKRTSWPDKKVTEGEARWVWYHDMNGFGIRDIFRFGRGAPASQRVFNPQTKQWHVWYFVGQKFYYAGEWIGGAKGDKLVFEKPDEKLGDKTILSRLEYYDITATSFKWHSLNLDPETGENLFTDWEISCERRH